MDGQVTFSQELLDQAVAAVKAQIGQDLGYLLILIEPPGPTQPRMLVGTNARNDLALCALGGAAQSIAAVGRQMQAGGIDDPS